MHIAFEHLPSPLAPSTEGEGAREVLMLEMPYAGEHHG
jgi:hypothetical protein